MTDKSIPADFPHAGSSTSLSGAHPKLAVRHDSDSGLYVAGATTEALAERYDICLDLVSQLVDKCRKNRVAKYATMTEATILSSFFDKLKKSGWGTESEMAWVIRHTALGLGWSPIDEAEKLLTSLK
jgi:hypothetical protein